MKIQLTKEKVDLTFSQVNDINRLFDELYFMVYPEYRGQIGVKLPRPFCGQALSDYIIFKLKEISGGEILNEAMNQIWNAIGFIPLKELGDWEIYQDQGGENEYQGRR